MSADAISDRSHLIDQKRTAILSLDVQTALVSIYVPQEQEAFLARVGRVLAHGRKREMPLFHVKVGFRPGLPEVSSRNALFSAIRNSPQHQAIFEGAYGAIHPAVAPEGDEPVITKHRVSAFTGTDLSMLLRAQEIETLILFGIATSGVVLSTALEAADHDYRLLVVRDCCADLDPELHRCLLEKLLPRLGQVVAADHFD